MWLAQAFLSVTLLLFVHLGAMAAASVAVGAEVAEIRIFFGPCVTVRAARPRVTVGALPFGGWVRCVGQSDADADTRPRRLRVAGARVLRASLSALA